MSHERYPPKGKELFLVWFLYSMGSIVWIALAVSGRNKLTAGLVIAMLFAVGTTLQALLRALGSSLIRRHS
jgi:hypothetical protein